MTCAPGGLGHPSHRILVRPWKAGLSLIPTLRVRKARPEELGDLPRSIQTQAPLIQSPLSSHSPRCLSGAPGRGDARCALGSFRRNHDSWAGSTGGLRGPGRVSKASGEGRSV